MVSMLTTQRRSLQHTEGKQLAPMSLLGGGQGGSASRLHRGPAWLYPGNDHNEVGSQLTSGVHLLNLLIYLKQSEGMLGEGSEMIPKYFSLDRAE